MNRLTIVRALTVLALVLLIAACGESGPVEAPTPLSTRIPAAPRQEPPPPPPPSQTATPEPAVAAPSTPTPVPVRRMSTPVPTASPTPTATVTATPDTTAGLFPYTVVDSNGVEVVFDWPPERIVAFDSAAVEALFAIQQGHRVVGTHDFVSFPPETEDIPRVGSAFNMNIEATVALEPDLVFVFFERFLPDIERAGLKALYLKTLSIDFGKTSAFIRMWGRITGAVEAAETEAARFEARVEGLRSAIESAKGGIRVFQDVGELWTPGSDTLMAEVFELLKLDNVAADVSGYQQFSPEVIVAKDPEVILAADPESILSNAAFAEISAVRQGRVFSLPSDALFTAGPRFAEGIEELAALVYPEIWEGS